MTELNTLTLAQITLIGIGALFQVMALCTAVTPIDSMNRPKNSNNDASDNNKDLEPENSYVTRSPAMSYQSFDDLGMRPGDMMSTAKLPFHQSCKLRHKVSQPYIES